MRWIISFFLSLLSAMALTAEAGPVAYWRFDKAGPDIEDLSGHGHTAKLTGGEIRFENGKRFLHLDGQTKIEVPSAPALCVQPGFSLEMRVRIADITDGRLLAFKDGEYLWRVDWPVEESRLSFFVNLAGSWEPRVKAFPPPVNQWLHLVASWDGQQLSLWINGLPYVQNRWGEPPAPTTNPLLIGTATGYGQGLIGDLEYVKIYRHALSAAEIIRAAYAAAGRTISPPSSQSQFDFTQGGQGWHALEGTTVQASPSGLIVGCEKLAAGIIHNNLQVPIGQRDYAIVRFAVNRGATGTLIFVTSRGAGQIRFPLKPDGQMHTYILEPWEYPGWEGTLQAMALLPSERQGSTARIQYLRLSEKLEGEGELSLRGLTTESTLPRAGRSEKICVTLRNAGGAVQGVKITLRVPAGVELLAPATQIVPRLAYQEEKEIAWPLRVRQPGKIEGVVTAQGPQTNLVSIRSALLFGPAVRLPKADYVPPPQPVDTGPYQIWTHYCPLWKQGTHYGWQLIEPWPERKPVLSFYNEGTPEVADWHIKYWREHGISAVIYCWYRANLNGPVKQSLGHAIHDGLLKARYLPLIKFGIMWENGCGKGVGSAEDLLENVLPFWLDNYFTHPSYLKIDGKPVLYIWVPGNVTRDLGGSDNVRATFEKMRQRCRERGLAGLYIVGCCGRADRTTLERMKAEGWDASSAYGNSWTYPASTVEEGKLKYAPYEEFVLQQEAIWKGKQEINALPDITTIMMGWDARPWSSSDFYWADNTPEKFRELCQRAKAHLDSRSDPGPERRTVIFCCWNEFGEGHYIEPTRGYGFSYLDAIRDTFSRAPQKHVDLAPEDVGLGPYDSWYRAAKQAGPARVCEQSSWRGAELAQWKAMMGIEDLAVQEGILSFTALTRDPALASPPLRLRSNRFTRFVVEMRVSKTGTAQIFWTNALVPNATEKASVRVEAVANGQFQRLEFAVSANETWGGRLKSLRFDPTDQEGARVEIRYMGLE